MVAQTPSCRARRSLRRRPGTKCLELVRERSPSRRDGVIMFSRVSLQRSCWPVLSSVMESKAVPTQSSCPSGTDRFFLRHSRHFVPGCPSGTISRRAITISERLWAEALGFCHKELALKRRLNAVVFRHGSQDTHFHRSHRSPFQLSGRISMELSQA